MTSLRALHFWSLGCRYSEEVLCLGFLNIGFLNDQNIYLFRGICSRTLAWIPPILQVSDLELDSVIITVGINNV